MQQRLSGRDHDSSQGAHMISSQLTRGLADANADRLRRAADHHRLARHRSSGAQPLTIERSVTLRFGSASDEQALSQLAQLDGSAPPKQPVLLAEVDGRLLVAMSLSEERIIADPFAQTGELIDLLRARARQLTGPSRPHRSRLRARLRWVFDL